jgi:tetratricopeptide (TPR) repeat protein
VLGSPWFAVLVIVAAVLASYANSLQGPFVFDDHTDIVDNPSIRRLWPLRNVFLVRSGSAAGLQTRPVANLSFALDYAVGGLNTMPYHVTNLAIHLFAGLALFGVVRRTLSLPRLPARFGRASVPLALAVALLWAVHPLQTESVTYVVQRYESMMGLFYLVAVYGLIRGSTSTHSYGWGAVAVAATLLALGSKEVAVSLPLMLLLYDRLLLAGSFAEIRHRRWWLYLALLAVWTAFALVQLYAGPRPWAGYELRWSWFEYARSQPGVILHYLRLVFWPQPLVLDYDWPPARSVGDILPGATVVAALLAATGYALWQWPAWGLLGAWFFMILAPTSSVMPLADLAFEHRMYLPLAAVAAAVVFAVYAVVAALPFSARPRQVALACLLGGVGLVLAVLTWQRNNDYRDEVLIWQDVVARRPNHPRAHNNLGNALTARGLVDEAIVHYQRALAIKPDLADAHYNLGLALAGRGLVDEAITHYRKALTIKPDLADAHYDLGRALAGRGLLDEAIVHYQKALTIKPDDGKTHNNFGAALASRGQVDEAITHFRKALEVNPDDVNALNNLGFTLAGRGRIDEAIAHFRKAVELDPDFVAAHINLADTLAGCGRLDEAIVHYQKALGLASARNDKAQADVIRARIRLHPLAAPAGRAP